MTNVLIMIDDQGDLSVDDELQTTQAVDNHKKWVDAAAYLSCYAIRVNLFGSDDRDACGQLSAFTQSFVRLCR